MYIFECFLPASVYERGAANALETITGAPLERCIEAIQQGLLAGYECEPDPETGRPPFAFRLHQFISKGDTIYASPEAKRFLTLQRQQYVPGDRERVLLPLIFCRECGQEYYCVRRKEGRFVPRALNDLLDDEGQTGFLYYSEDHPWPDDEDNLLERLPDDWIEEYKSSYRVRRSRRKDLPLFSGSFLATTSAMASPLSPLLVRISDALRHRISPLGAVLPYEFFFIPGSFSLLKRQSAPAAIGE